MPARCPSRVLHKWRHVPGRRQYAECTACSRCARAAKSRLTAEHLQPAYRGQWDSGWDTHGVRASPGGAPLGVNERVYREPAERGRDTRAFNPTRLFSVDAVEKRTRAWLGRRADGLVATEQCAARNKRAIIDRKGRGLRCLDPTPRGHMTPFIYMMTFEIDVITKIERALLGRTREEADRRGSGRAAFALAGGTYAQPYCAAAQL